MSLFHEKLNHYILEEIFYYYVEYSVQFKAVNKNKSI